MGRENGKTGKRLGGMGKDWVDHGPSGYGMVRVDHQDVR